MIANYNPINSGASSPLEHKNIPSSRFVSKSVSKLSIATFTLLASLIINSCTPVNQTTIEERPQSTGAINTTDSIQIDLSFDPLGAEGDALIVPEFLRDSVTLSLSSDRANPTDSTITDFSQNGLMEISDSLPPGFNSPKDTLAYDTYRIQLFNSRVYLESALERSVATEIFDYTVTLDYEVPYFKVRLGDFSDRKAAETYLKDYVKPAGYPDSWVARVRVTPQKSAVAQAQLTAYFDSLRTAILLEGLDLEALDSLGVLDSLFDELGIDSSYFDSIMSDSTQSENDDSEGQ